MSQKEQIHFYYFACNKSEKAFPKRFFFVFWIFGSIYINVLSSGVVLIRHCHRQHHWHCLGTALLATNLIIEIISCTYVRTYAPCIFTWTLGKCDRHFSNGKHFALPLIAFPAYEFDYRAFRCTLIEITRSLWQKFSNLWTFFNLTRKWLLNSNLTKLRVNLDLFEICVTDYLPNELRSTRTLSFTV